MVRAMGRARTPATPRGREERAPGPAPPATRRGPGSGRPGSRLRVAPSCPGSSAPFSGGAGGQGKTRGITSAGKDHDMTEKTGRLAAAMAACLSAAAAATPAAAAVAPPSPSPPATRPGPQGGGVTLLPNGWRIAPAARHITMGDLPLAMVESADGRYLIVSNDGYAKPTLSVV